MLLEPGRVCIKKNGRDAGSKAVVTKVIDNKFVSIITAKRVKEEVQRLPSRVPQRKNRRP